MATRCLVPALLLMALSGCMADQKQQVAACELEAMRVYSGEQIGGSANIRSYVQLCMTAHGYQWNSAADGCATSFPAEQNPYCYVPAGRIARFLSRVTLSLGHAKNSSGRALASLTPRGILL